MYEQPSQSYASTGGVTPKVTKVESQINEVGGLLREIEMRAEHFLFPSVPSNEIKSTPSPLTHIETRLEGLIRQAQSLLNRFPN